MLKVTLDSYNFLAGFTSDHPCIESTLYTLNTWVVWKPPKKWKLYLWNPATCTSGNHIEHFQDYLNTSHILCLDAFYYISSSYSYVCECMYECISLLVLRLSPSSLFCKSEYNCISRYSSDMICFLLKETFLLETKTQRMSLYEI